MEDDGLEVFFEDSPSALYVDPSAREDLLIQNEDNKVEERPVIKIPSRVGVVRQMWEWLMCVLFGPLYEVFVFAWWSTLSRIPLNSILVNYSNGLSRMTYEIGDSPLLTDEDHHLLHSVRESHSLENHTHTPLFLVLRFSNWKFLSCVVILASLWLPWISKGGDILIPACVISLLLLPGIWRQFLVWWVWQQVQQDQRVRDQYYRSFDLLLNQLTSTLRWLQEVEVIGQGFARPHPLSKSLHQMDSYEHTYKHVTLRRCLLSVSSHLVHIMRTATREMHQKVEHLGCGHGWLGAELMDKRNYLAFTSLSELHPHLTIQDEWKTIEDTTSIHLDSLKDAASLVGVLNSQLLRLLFLGATLACRHDTGVGERAGLLRSVRMVRLLSACLRGLVGEVESATRELTSALTFNKNMLLEPPNLNSTKNGLTSDLQGLVDQVHYLDLKAHCLLLRVRSLKDHIQEVGVVPPDLAVEVDCVQVCVRGVADSADVLSSMMKHSDTEEEEEELLACQPVAMETEVSAAGDEVEWESSESECYMCEGRLESGEEDLEQEEETEVLGKYEVPVGMMRELQSVLTLRQEDKEKRRRLKKKKRCRNGHSHKEQDTEHAQSVTSINDTQDLGTSDDYDTEHAQNAINPTGADTEHAQNAIKQADNLKADLEEDDSQHIDDGDNHGGVANDHERVADEHGGVAAGVAPPRQGVKFSPFTPHSLSEQLKSAILQRRNVSPEETFS